MEGCLAGLAPCGVKHECAFFDIHPIPLAISHCLLLPLHATTFALRIKGCGSCGEAEKHQLWNISTMETIAIPKHHCVGMLVVCSANSAQKLLLPGSWYPVGCTVSGIW